MATKCLRARDNFVAQPNCEECIYFSSDSYCLSKVDSNLYFSRNGKYPEKCYIEWSNFKSQALTQLLSFNPIVSYEKDRFYRENHPEFFYGKFLFQLSNDNGSNYYYWDGLNWVLCTNPSDENQWNTDEEIDKNISTFPLIRNSSDDTVQIRPRVLIFSGGLILNDTPFKHDRSITPRIYEIDFTVKYDYDTIMDLLNSVKNYVENNFSARFIILYQMENADNKFVLNSDFTNISGISVFNLTTDPNKTNNIFSNIVGDVVNLTTSVSQDDILEFVFTGTCPVKIQEDVEIEIAEIPVIIIHGIDKNIEKSIGSFEGFEILPKISEDFSYVQKEPKWSTSFLHLACVSSNEGVAIFMAGALSSLFENAKVISSLATGDYFYIMDVKPYEDQNSISTNLNKKLLTMELMYKDWSRSGNDEEIEEVTNIKEIYLNVESLGNTQVAPEFSKEEDLIK